MNPWDLITLLLMAMPLLFCGGVWLGRVLEREQVRADGWLLVRAQLLDEFALPLTPEEREYAEAVADDIDQTGCDCTELCSMGPTCPGGMLARLPGAGCWRVVSDDD